MCKRVVFIGAGFSAGIHYPVGSELLHGLLDYLKGKRPRHLPKSAKQAFENTLQTDRTLKEERDQLVKSIHEVLDEYFAVSVEKASIVNVVDFFTIVQTLTEAPGLLSTVDERRPNRLQQLEKQERFRRLYSQLSAVIRTYFQDIFDDAPLSDDMASVLNAVKASRDAIVDFNWDEEVDFALTERSEIAYTRGSWNRKKEFLILKPHGSIGWYDLRQGIVQDDLYLIAAGDKRIPRFEKHIVAYNETESPFDLEDEGGGKKRKKGEEGKRKKEPAKQSFLLNCPPVITPPTFSKNFRYAEQQVIWQDVISICGSASEFLFLGYSLPPDDFLTKAAIRCARRNARRSSGRTGRRLRCLVVGMDGKMIQTNFADVFDNMSNKNNFLPWTFGVSKDRRPLATLIEEKLKSAWVS